MDANQAQVKDFFNSHSADYKTKYNSQNVFYEYFFYERLEKATSSLDLDNKKILDVGAGTGPLYDFLDKKGVRLGNYYASDISKDMLQQSAIPEDRQFVGDITNLRFGKDFDFVFMLGVTTYMDPDGVREAFHTIGRLLKPGGSLIVTFTNRNSLDIFLRSHLKAIGKIFSKSDSILSQKFKTWYYSRREASELIPSYMKEEKLVGLNHTIFPFSRLFPRLSVIIARKSMGISSSFLSSDLLFFFVKVDS